MARPTARAYAGRWPSPLGQLAGQGSPGPLSALHFPANKLNALTNLESSLSRRAGQGLGPPPCLCPPPQGPPRTLTADQAHSARCSSCRQLLGSHQLGVILERIRDRNPQARWATAECELGSQSRAGPSQGPPASQVPGTEPVLRPRAAQRPDSVGTEHCRQGGALGVAAGSSPPDGRDVSGWPETHP